MKITTLIPLFLAAFAFSPSFAAAQVLYTSELNSNDGWTIVADEDTDYEFDFDYTTFGIPANPNSSASATTGLKLAANLEDPAAAAAISATPTGFSASGSYQVKADFWLNFNTSGGTTEYQGAFVGYDPAGSPINGIGILGDSDGDSGSDYRIYSAGAQVAARNNSEADIAAAFPGATVPALQSDDTQFDPINVSVTAADGTLGFAWHTLTIDVNGTTGMVDLSINDFLMGTVDSSADPSALEGGIALSFADLFSSVSTKPEFSFGIFDNVSVTQVPEPNSMVLAAFGILAIGCVRRRR